MAFHTVGGFGRTSGSLFHHLVLQAAGKHHDTLFCGIVFQEFLSGFLGRFTGCRLFGLFLGIAAAQIVYNHLLPFYFVYRELRACINVLYRPGEIFKIQVFTAQILQLSAYSQA